MRCKHQLAKNAIGGYQRQCGALAWYELRGTPLCKTHAAQRVMRMFEQQPELGRGIGLISLGVKIGG